MPLSAAWCRRPRRFSHRFQRRFYRPIRDILCGHGRRQRGLVPLPKRTDAEEASHDHPEDGPGPTDSDVPVPLSPAKSQYRPPDPARAPVFPPFSPSDSLHFHGSTSAISSGAAFTDNVGALRTSRAWSEDFPELRDA